MLTYGQWDHWRRRLERRTPNFANLRAVLRGGRPDRPVLFEMAHNVGFARPVMGDLWLADSFPGAPQRNYINAFRWTGYDYAIAPTWPYKLSRGGQMPGRSKKDGAQSVSLNEGGVIRDWESFERFEWPEPVPAEYERMGELGEWVPEGMRLVLRGSGSILEMLVQLCGYEDLCYLLIDQQDLVAALSAKLEALCLEHTRLALQHEFFGAVLFSDDWGFKTSTLVSPADLRRHVLPVHANLVAAVHEADRPAILHSCGKLDEVFDDIIAIGYDAKHSFEDAATPVDEIYRRWGGQVGILGGVDMDLLARGAPGAIRRRSEDLLALTASRGYALGSGNSLPDYIPPESYFAMIAPALEPEAHG
jgi:uroporphyrinogen decarboxylase